MTRIDFETATTGALPSGVTAALTGSGGPVAWAVVEDPTAPAGPKVLAQTSTDKTDYRFPLAIFDGSRSQRTSMSRCASSRSPARSTGRRASPSA